MKDIKINIGQTPEGEPVSLNVWGHLISYGLSIFGKRRSGKTYLIGLICEKLSEVNQPYVIIDIMGNYYTLKEKYSVIVASVGEKKYADLPNITPEVSRTLARAIVESRQSTIIDLSEARMLEQYEFLVGFLEEFYEACKSEKKPIILIMDEIHRLVPEKSTARLRDLAELIQKVTYWVIDIARTGGNHGIGYIIAGQREAETAKTVITQAEIQIYFKMSGADIKYLSGRLSKETLEKLPSLGVGEAVFVMDDREIFFKVGSRLTTPAGKTPDLILEPGKLRKVDLTRLRKAMEKIEKVKKVTPEKERIDSKLVEKLKNKVKELQQKVHELTIERDVAHEELEIQLERLKSENQVLKNENEALKKKLMEVDVEAYQEEISELNRRISDLELKLKEYKEQIAEASRLEEELQRIRSAAENLAEDIIDFVDAIGLEVIPQDTIELKKRVEELEAELRIYKSTEEERKARVEETLNDIKVKSQVEELKRFLRQLKHRSGVFPEVLKQAVRLDPTIYITPEDISADVTVETRRKYLKDLSRMGLLIEKNGKFRNAIGLWVMNKIRKIDPMAPDDAIELITEDLIKEVVGG